MRTQWYNNIMANAKAMYERDGWDMFVECIDFADFNSDCERFQLDTYDKAVLHYTELCLAKAEQREEQYAMAREGW